MIPRALPALMQTALLGGWDVHVEQDLVGVEARFARGNDLVHLAWADGRIEESSIDFTPTPYTQCVALIRNPEGA